MKVPVYTIKALVRAMEEISREAGQMDGHCKPPVLISHDAIIQLRKAIDSLPRGF